MPSAAEKEADEKIAEALDFAERKVTLTEIEDHLSLEAHRIEGSERSRLLAGFIEHPHPDQIERLVKFHAARRLIQKLISEPRAAADWLRGRNDGQA
jgi:hypothetical protein